MNFLNSPWVTQGINIGASALTNMMAANTQKKYHEYNARQLKRTARLNSDAERKRNSYLMGQDRVAVGASGIVGGSKLDAMADTARTLEQRAGETELKYYSMATEQNAMASMQSPLMSVLPLAGEFAKWFLNNPVVQSNSGMQSTYLQSGAHINSNQSSVNLGLWG